MRVALVRSLFSRRPEPVSVTHVKGTKEVSMDPSFNLLRILIHSLNCRADHPIIEEVFMFNRSDVNGYKDVLDRIKLKTLVYGAKTLMAEFRLEQGAVLPRHKHPHEQTGYLVTGRIDLTIGNVTQQAVPGDSWCIPGDVEHNAVARENSVAIEVFSPVREDYLP